MQNNFITKISPNVRFTVFLLIILILIFANSIYLIAFTTTLILIMLILTEKKVNQYVNSFKNLIFPLLNLFVLYIIVFKEYNLFSTILFWYKSVLSVVLIDIFIFNTNFKSLNEGVYSFFSALKLLKVNVERFSFDISMSLYFIKIFVDSKQEILYVQKSNGIIKHNIKNYLFSRVIYSINTLNLFQENLKIDLYKLNYAKADFKSKIIFLTFLIIFIICIFKEVIL